MFTVYINVNSSGVLYIGMSLSKSQRLEQHRMGISAATNKGDMNWRHLHIWSLPNFQAMSRLERVLQRIQDKDGDDAIRRIVKKHPTFDSYLSGLVNQMQSTAADAIDTCFPWSQNKILLRRAKAKIAHYVATGETTDAIPVDWDKLSMRYYHAAWLLEVNLDGTASECADMARDVYNNQLIRLKVAAGMAKLSDEEAVTQFILNGPTKMLPARRSTFISIAQSVKHRKIKAFHKTNPRATPTVADSIVTPSEVRDRIRSNAASLRAKEKDRHLEKLKEKAAKKAKALAHAAAKAEAVAPVQVNAPNQEIKHLIDRVVAIIDNPTYDKLTKRPFRDHLRGLQMHFKLQQTPDGMFSATNKSLCDELIARVNMDLHQLSTH